MNKKQILKGSKNRSLKQNMLRITVRIFVWFGAAVIYYLAFSLFFDTPIEYEMKHSTDRLRHEYETLVARFDSLGLASNNIAARDKNIFRILFESDPYDFSPVLGETNLSNYEAILNKSTFQLKKELRNRLGKLEKTAEQLNDSYSVLQTKIDSLGSNCNYIPAIQPVINKRLTLLTASYGMRINPFYKTLKSHQGVDYTIPEGSRVFATADGRVREVSQRNSTAGQTIIIDHGNGYETLFSHLGTANVSQGQQVRRGDIIALSGNSGLSFAPHLHYEVRHNGMRVDPIHYFFMELSPSEYQRIIRIAQSGMQSFD